MGTVFVLLAVIFVLLPIFILHRVYRKKVQSWEALYRTGVATIYRADGIKVKNHRFDDKEGKNKDVPPHEAIFMEFDLRRIRAACVYPRHRYLDQDWKPIDHATPEFREALRHHEARYRKAYENNQGRPERDRNLLAAAPYMYLEVSFLGSTQSQKSQLATSR